MTDTDSTGDLDVAQPEDFFSTREADDEINPVIQASDEAECDDSVNWSISGQAEGSVGREHLLEQYVASKDRHVRFVEDILDIECASTQARIA